MMPVKFVDHYTPQDCRNNPDSLYVFGDNFQRNGKGGQAIIRDEPNAVGIATKWAPTMKERAFFKDEDMTDWDGMNVTAYNSIEMHLAQGGVVVFPANGLGTCRAQLEMRAPKIFVELQSWVANWVKRYGLTEDK